jgi:hypothetical protein
VYCHVRNIDGPVEIIHRSRPFKSPTELISEVVQPASSIWVVLGCGIYCHVHNIDGTVEVTH